jgi:hypothetical protein
MVVASLSRQHARRPSATPASPTTLNTNVQHDPQQHRNAQHFPTSLR